MSERKDMRGDPWSGLPNLAAGTADTQEETRGADPRRFYASGAGGVDDVVTNRILNQPRCLLNYSQEIPHIGGGGTTPGFASIGYDTDGMCTSGSPLITMRTAGLYAVTMMAVWAGGGGGGQVWSRVIEDVNPAVFMVTCTAKWDISAWGAHFTATGVWAGKVGHTASMYNQSDININLSNMLLAVTRISTLGSD